MQNNEDLFFERMPQSLPLYQLFAEKVLAEYPDAQIIIQKSQIAFYDKHNFAFVWLPIRRMKNRPEIYIIVSFVLAYRLDSPRIIESTEPYPNRWTHHVIVQDQNEIDTELMDWMKEAHDFAVKK
ncbi:MAG TPA: hypothetical protein GXZ59_05860 [Clostridiaceae bacterium]|nr:hypothetical protein [Clostridiaceae bacterium]